MLKGCKRVNRQAQVAVPQAKKQTKKLVEMQTDRHIYAEKQIKQRQTDRQTNEINKKSDRRTTRKQISRDIKAESVRRTKNMLPFSYASQRVIK